MADTASPSTRAALAPKNRWDDDQPAAESDEEEVEEE